MAKSLEFLESYSCVRDCKTPTGWDRTKREGRGCTRADLPPVVWDVDARRLHAPRRERNACLYLGRHGDASLEGTVDLRPVDHEEPLEASGEGCPGGWYRTAWASSVLRYRRRRTGEGGRVENGLLPPRGEGVQIWAAVLELEREEERAHGYASEKSRDIAAKAAKKRKGSSGGRRS